MGTEEGGHDEIGKMMGSLESVLFVGGKRRATVGGGDCNEGHCLEGIRGKGEIREEASEGGIGVRETG